MGIQTAPSNAHSLLQKTKTWSGACYSQKEYEEDFFSQLAIHFPSCQHQYRSWKNIVKMRKQLCKICLPLSAPYLSHSLNKLPQVLNTETEEKYFEVFHWDVKIITFAHITKCMTRLGQLI